MNRFLKSSYNPGKLISVILLTVLINSQNAFAHGEIDTEIFYTFSASECVNCVTTGPPGGINDIGFDTGILSETKHPFYSEITKTVTEEIIRLKSENPDLYCEILETLNDEQYAQFLMYMPVVLQESEDQKYCSEIPAIEGLGSAYIYDKYGLDISNMDDEALVSVMHELQANDPEEYLDIISNMPDGLYGKYIELDTYYRDHGLYRTVRSLTPFTSKDGNLISGSAVLTETDGIPVLPDPLIFLIEYTDGSRSYEYASGNKFSFFPDANGIRAVYRDKDGITGECLLTVSSTFIYDDVTSKGFIVQIPGDTDIRDIRNHLKSDGNNENTGSECE